MGEIGIIRLQDRQIVTTAASTLLTGRNTEWINRACYTFTRWTGLQQTNDKRWFLVTTGFGITFHPWTPKTNASCAGKLSTRDPEIYAPRPEREGIHASCSHSFYFFFFSRNGNRIKPRSTLGLELFNSRLSGSIDQSCWVNELGFWLKLEPAMKGNRVKWSSQFLLTRTNSIPINWSNLEFWKGFSFFSFFFFFKF